MLLLWRFNDREQDVAGKYFCGMIRQLRNSNIKSLFYGFMALYMLNISVDSPDKYPNYVPEDLSFNDQESIFEIIIEGVLGCEDAIPEYDDNDLNENNTTKNNITIDNFVLPYLNQDLTAILLKKKNKTIYFSYVPLHYLEIHLPPPEA